MGLKLSTGLRNAMLNASGKSFTDALTQGASGTAGSGGTCTRINIYSGAEPATADAAATGTLLCTITNTTGVSSDYNLAFLTSTVGILAKNTDTWQGTCVASGTAGYFRVIRSPTAASIPDTGASSTTEIRLQGDIATSGAVLNLSNPVLVNAAVQNVDYFSMTLPGA